MSSSRGAALLSTADVAVMAGVTPNLVSRWTVRGFLHAARPAGGSGSSRWYAWEQARIAAVLGLVLAATPRGQRHPWWIDAAVEGLAAVDDWHRRVLVADSEAVQVVHIDALPGVLESHVGVCTLVSLDPWSRSVLNPRAEVSK